MPEKVIYFFCIIHSILQSEIWIRCIPNTPHIRNVLVKRLVIYWNTSLAQGPRWRKALPCVSYFRRLCRPTNNSSLAHGPTLAHGSSHVPTIPAGSAGKPTIPT